MKVGVLVGVTLIVCVGAFILKEMKCSFNPLISFFFCVILISQALILISPVLLQIKALGNEWEQIGKYLPYLFKGAGISIVAEISSDLCKEAGLTSASQGVDFLGKCAIVSLSFPLACEVFSICVQMLKDG